MVALLLCALALVLLCYLIDPSSSKPTYTRCTNCGKPCHPDGYCKPCEDAFCPF